MQNFKSFTGFEYLLIDVANQLDNPQFTSDKDLFEDRIQWCREHLDTLEEYLPHAGQPELYMKAVMAVRAAQRGEPSGHLVSLDAICSGLQIMGACLNDYNACFFTGLLDSGERPDAYMATTVAMAVRDAVRSDVKYAVMTHFYGSEAKPKELFPSPLMLNSFYEAVNYIAPLCNQFRNYAIGTWNPTALEHSWTLPDGTEVVIPVVVKREVQVEIPELGKKFTHYIEEIMPEEGRVSNAANIIHSLDAMLVNEMDRACNYDSAEHSKTARSIKQCTEFAAAPQHRLEKLYRNTRYFSLRALSLVGEVGAHEFTQGFCDKVMEQMALVESYRSFPLLTNHDAFSSHANHCNRVRWWYREFLARFAEARILEDIYLQLTGRELPIQRGTVEPDWIRSAVYPLS